MTSVTSAIEEEFKRSERLDAKSRNQLTVTGTFFTVVQAITIGLINGALGSTDTKPASSFVMWLAIAGGLAGIGMVATIATSYVAWRLRDDHTLSVKTIRAYMEPAREGNPAVGVKLVQAYADIADDRRQQNGMRAKDLEKASRACAITLALAGAQLVLAFVAVAVQ